MNKKLLSQIIVVLCGLALSFLIVSLFQLREDFISTSEDNAEHEGVSKPAQENIAALVKPLNMFSNAVAGGADINSLRRALNELMRENPQILFAAIYDRDTQRIDDPSTLVKGIDIRSIRYASQTQRGRGNRNQTQLSPRITTGLLLAQHIDALQETPSDPLAEDLQLTAIYEPGNQRVTTKISQPNEIEIDGTKPIMIWMLKPIRDLNSGEMTNVIALLVDLRAVLTSELVNAGKNIEIDAGSHLARRAQRVYTSTATIHGPYPADQLHKIAASGEFDSDNTSSSVSERISGFLGKRAKTLSYPLEIGEQGFWVKTRMIDSESGMSIYIYIGSIVIGFAGALAVYSVFRGERDLVQQLRTANARILQRVEAKQRQLNSSESRFRHLAESTNVIPWEANIRHARFTYVGPQIDKLAGYPVETWHSEGFWLHHIYPDDRQRVLVDGFRNIRAGEYATHEYRIRNADGEMVYVRNIMTVLPPKKRGVPPEVAQGFMIDISDMKRAQETLEDARIHAEQANRSKSEFLANMSHELRTPLNAVIGFSEIMKNEIFGKIGSRYRDYAESIHTSGRHLLELINDVLDLSKIEAGKIELMEEDTDIEELIQSCASLLSDRATEEGVTLSAETEGVIPPMLLDGRRIRQVLLNLISNAIKFTPASGNVHVTGVYYPGHGVQIAVSDTGVGMSEEDIPRAFEKFGQIDGELARDHEGTGLGLPIARSLVELHGGELTIDSTLGEGTCVTITLPIERVQGVVTDEDDPFAQDSLKAV